MGETENVGNPGTPEEKAYGRSLPKPTMPDFPIRGYEYYDYRHDVVNTTFRNYEDNATRKTRRDLQPAVQQLRRQHQQRPSSSAEVRERQAGVLPADGEQRQVGQRQWRQHFVQDRGVHRTRTARRGGGPNSYVIIHDGVNDSIAVDTTGLRDQAHLERRGVQGRCGAHELLQRSRPWLSWGALTA